MDTFFSNVLEFFFILIGFQMLYTSYKVFKKKSNTKRIGTSLFWFDLGLIFVLGKVMPSVVSGLLVVLLGVISLFKQFESNTFKPFDQKKLDQDAQKYRNLVFIPVLCLAIVSVVLAMVIKSSSTSAIGIASIIGIVGTMIIFKSRPRDIAHESDRMIQAMGTSGILPQLLAALGTIFTISGVGDVISQLIGNLVPESNRFIGVVAYVLGMVVFTIIMGNGFAAFTVITVGIGLPFVIAQGADPAIAGALAMTAGYCGTLLTPMAANFNALPASLLDMKSPYGVIKQQAVIAIVMIVFHIVLMYVWAF